jgi:hypothetical protein
MRRVVNVLVLAAAVLVAPLAATAATDANISGEEEEESVGEEEDGEEEESPSRPVTTTTTTTAPATTIAPESSLPTVTDPAAPDSSSPDTTEAFDPPVTSTPDTSPDSTEAVGPPETSTPDTIVDDTTVDDTIPVEPENETTTSLVEPDLSEVDPDSGAAVPSSVDTTDGAEPTTATEQISDTRALPSTGAPIAGTLQAALMIATGGIFLLLAGTLRRRVTVG